MTRESSAISVLAQLWQSPWTRWVGGRYLRSKKNNRFLN
ncbi:MAG: hypothetical protein RJB38_1266, partial [Pseudomonadota bacterium]